MAKPLLTDELWQLIEPLLPSPRSRRFRYPGRKPLTHRQALTGILFVLKTGLNWNDLPQELHCGSGSRCRRRLAEWQEAGVWVQLHALLLDHLQGADKIDWSRAAVDSTFALHSFQPWPVGLCRTASRSRFRRADRVCFTAEPSKA